MTDPQLPPPVPQAPQPPQAPPVQQTTPPPYPPPAPAASPQPPAPSYAPPAGAYAAPAAGYQAAAGPYTPPTAAPSQTLGTVALGLALVALVIPSIIAAITGYGVGAGMNQDLLDTGGFEAFSPVRSTVLVAEITFWVGTALGITALVQGIMAISRRRGRGKGIAAIVVSLVAAASFFTIGFLAFLVGGASAMAY